MTEENKGWDIFKRKFISSRAAVFKVAEFLNREKNCTVTVPQMQLAPDPTYASEYRDDGDITVNGDHIVEVKHRSLSFTSAATYRYDDIIIANVESADRHDAYAYFIVNKPMTHAAIVYGKTKPKWYKRTVREIERGTTEEKYLCDKKDAVFVQL